MLYSRFARACSMNPLSSWHSGSPSARSFSQSPSPPPPSFTQYPSPPRSLVRDGQTSPLRPRLVVSRRTCPPLSPSPHANSFVIGTAVINTHCHDNVGERERERERERSLLGTTVHNGGSRAAPAARTPHHHALSCFPTHNGGVASYMAKTFPGL